MKPAILLAAIALAGCGRGPPPATVIIDEDFVTAMQRCRSRAVLTGATDIDYETAVYWRGDTALYCEGDGP